MLGLVNAELGALFKVGETLKTRRTDRGRGSWLIPKSEGNMCYRCDFIPCRSSSRAMRDENLERCSWTVIKVSNGKSLFSSGGVSVVDTISMISLVEVEAYQYVDTS